MGEGSGRRLNSAVVDDNTSYILLCILWDVQHVLTCYMHGIPQRFHFVSLSDQSEEEANRPGQSACSSCGLPAQLGPAPSAAAETGTGWGGVACTRGAA